MFIPPNQIAESYKGLLILERGRLLWWLLAVLGFLKVHAQVAGSACLATQPGFWSGAFDVLMVRGAVAVGS